MIRIEVSGLDALGPKLQALGQDAPKAITRGINKTLRTVNAGVIRGLAEDTGLPQRTIRDLTFRGKPAVETQRATYTAPVGMIAVTSNRLPLSLFRPRQTRTGVSYRLPSGRGAIPSGFITTFRSGHIAVVRRAEAQGAMPRRRRGGRRRPAAGILMVGRMPIIERFGPSLPHIMRTRLLDPTLADARATLEKNLEHEIDFIMSQRVAAGDE